MLNALAAARSLLGIMVNRPISTRSMEGDAEGIRFDVDVDGHIVHAHIIDHRLPRAPAHACLTRASAKVPFRWQARHGSSNRERRDGKRPDRQPGLHDRSSRALKLPGAIPSGCCLRHSCAYKWG